MHIARTSFTVGTRKVRRGQVLSDDDPIIDGRRHLFEHAGKGPDRPVEQATASPGERRAVGTPDDDGTVPCPDCGRRFKKAGLPRHRASHDGS